MNPWSWLIPLGDLQLTVPAAAGIGASLFVARRRRLACCWWLLFTGALLLVGANKIAYLGWGMGLPALQFKALSGHATGAGAMLPMLFATVCCWAGCQQRWRAAAFASGVALALLVSAALIMTREHSVSESLAGSVLGVTAAATAHRLAGICGAGESGVRRLSLLAFGATFAIGVWLMQFAHVGYWMIKAACILSGQARLFALGFD